MARALVDGLAIAYDDLGPRHDEALLCLPGWCVNRGFFTPLAERLSARRRVWSLDWRGRGDSDAPAGDFGHAPLVDDALAVIAAAGVRHVVPVAGVSELLRDAGAPRVRGPAVDLDAVERRRGQLEAGAGERAGGLGG